MVAPAPSALLDAVVVGSGRINFSAAGTAASRPPLPPGEPMPVTRIRAAPTGAHVIRRRADFKSEAFTSQDPDRNDIKREARKAFRTHRSVIGPDYADFEQQFGAEAQASDSKLGVALIDLRHDPTDYGEFDLDNPQHVALLFFEIMKNVRRRLEVYDVTRSLGDVFGEQSKTLMAAAGTSQERHDEIVANVGGVWNRLWLRDAFSEIQLRPAADIGGDASHFGAREAKWTVFDQKNVEHLKKLYIQLAKKLARQDPSALPSVKSGKGHKVEQFAFLGTGAAVAYHMTANSRSIDPDRTIVIGEAQPWDPHAPGRRGFASVNHPMGMITPRRDTTGAGDTGFADTGEFSKDVAAVIAAHSRARINARIAEKGVSKVEDEAYYSITTTDGRTFYAQHVVSALGIGPHTTPVRGRAVTTEEQPRVLDMDEFHRQLQDPGTAVGRLTADREGSKQRLAICLAGPNAGVDVAFSASRAGIDVVWLAASGPAWVEGFANYAIVPERVTIVLAYFGGYELAREKDRITGVTVSAGQDKYSEKAAEPLKRAGFRVATKPNEAVEGMVFDFLVYAVGPDTSKVTNVFDEPLRGELGKAEWDIHDVGTGRFSAPVSEPALDISRRDDPAPLLKAAVSAWFAKRFEDAELSTQADEAMRGMERVLGKLDKLRALPADVTLNRRIVAPDGSSVEIVGGQAARLDKIDMGAVQETLGPTVVGGDQLTPIRSRAEASAAFVPGYIGSDVNLVTDDQVVIAAHIALSYDIPPLVADYVTQRIIADRRKGEHEVRPVPEESGSFGRQFNTMWKQRLVDLERIFKG